MSWQETISFISLLKRSGYTDNELYDMYVRVDRGDMSAMKRMARLHDEYREYLPMGATTIEDKVNDIMYELYHYFEPRQNNSSNSIPGMGNNPPSSAVSSTSDTAESSLDIEIDSSTLKNIIQYAQNQSLRTQKGNIVETSTSMNNQNMPINAANDGFNWQCTCCGFDGNTRKFCMECGTPRPKAQSQDVSWICSCGYAENTRNFCAECGRPKPKDNA